jgi:hypothetical protein
MSCFFTQLLCGFFVSNDEDAWNDQKNVRLADHRRGVWEAASALMPGCRRVAMYGLPGLALISG